MSQVSPVIATDHEPEQASLQNYLVGFGGSLILTLFAYLLVTETSLAMRIKVTVITICALTQFGLQLVYFLHLGREFKPRWKLAMFGLMIMVVLILVGGSLWIMSNLNSRMSPTEMLRYMTGQDSL